MIVSALLLPRSVPRQAFDRAFLQGDVLVSDATIEELDRVLRRSRFDRYITQAERLQFLAAFIQNAVVIEVTEVVMDCRDPKDNKFLELAIDGSATCIISGDDDLLTLHPFRDTPILTPQMSVSQS